MNVLSLFDGMSCGRLALDRAGIKYNKYYASEISKPKIKAALNYYPDTNQLGDIKNIHAADLPKIDMLIGGSPCQGFSIMGKRLNFTDERSGLIMEYFRLLEELKPTYFLLENVPMDKQCEIEISRRLGVLPVKINAALVSAQNRKRIYWTNIPGTGVNLFGDEIEQPKDKGIMLKDILQPESEIEEKYYLHNRNKEYIKKRLPEGYCCLNGEKARTLLETYGNLNGTLISDQFINKNQNGKGYKENPEKAYTLNTVDRQSLVIDIDKLRIRKLTPIECCRLQTVPDNYFDGSGISDNQQYSCLGDGWTVDVIVYILKGVHL